MLLDRKNHNHALRPVCCAHKAQRAAQTNSEIEIGCLRIGLWEPKSAGFPLTNVTLATVSSRSSLPWAQNESMRPTHIPPANGVSA